MTDLKFLAALTVAAGIAASAVPAHADEIIIKDFIGRVTIDTAPENRLDIVRQDNAASAAFEMTGRNLSVDGNVRKPNSKGCSTVFGSLSWGDKDEKTANFGGYKNLKDYPVLVLTAPDTVSVYIENAIIFGSAGNIGALSLSDKHCSRYSIGNISGPATMTISGSADFDIGTAGDIDLSLGGSADISVGDAGRVDAMLGGSSSADFGHTGPVSINLGGSSDAEFGDIAGDIRASAGGSADIDMGRVSGGADLSASGASDIDIASVNGPIVARASGSADIEIAGGTAPRADIGVSGSADISFDGVAGHAKLRASGSGSIDIASVTGEAKTQTSGSGSIDIN